MLTEFEERIAKKYDRALQLGALLFIENTLLILPTDGVNVRECFLIVITKYYIINLFGHML